jgi:hypothetical protein
VNGSLRRPKFRQCAYCLGEFPRAQITNDHIIAGSWYPDTTPSAVQRWTVPACRRCNNHFSSIERYVHARLAACVDPTHPAAAGMWEKARNSIDPKQARTPREREHRIRQREAFWSGLRELREAPPHTLPFSISNLAKGSRTGVIIEAEKLNSLVEKWVRGIYYKIHGQPLSSAGEISVIHIHEEEAATAFGKFWEQRKFLDAGPGIQVSYLSVEEGSKRADVYVFKIWNQFEVFASADDEIANDHFGSRYGC